MSSTSFLHISVSPLCDMKKPAGISSDISLPGARMPMKTKIWSIADPKARAEAIVLLRERQVIAAPTDTVYGVMCRYDSADAVARLYAVKGRPHQKAIPVLISDFEQLQSVAKSPIVRLARELIQCLWPGPLTLILPARPQLPAILTAGRPTVAVRMPDHDARARADSACGAVGRNQRKSQRCT